MDGILIRFSENAPNGLARYDLNNSDWKTYFFDEKYFGLLPAYNNKTMTFDNNGNIWIYIFGPSASSKLVHFDIDDEKFTYYDYDNFLKVGILSIRAIDNKLFISGVGGLDIYDVDTEDIKHFDFKRIDLWV